MKDRETILVERWRTERPMFEAWGSFVCETLVASIAATIYPASTSHFFRIPVTHRTKDENSLLAKAFHRGKDYSNPYDQIEDKVGVRIVVLFSEEIRLVEEAIKSCSRWASEMARDYEKERELRPFEFNYQSLHYIIRANLIEEFNGTSISKGTSCEVQVRTLLQHAYSELTHDTIYKPSVAAEPAVKRAAAKSMALIEATDDYFSQVRERIALAAAPGQQISAVLKTALEKFANFAVAPSPLNTLIIDHYKKWAKADFEPAIKSFVEQKQFLRDIILRRAETQILYRQPAILLVYWVIAQAPRGAASNSPLSDDELGPLYSDLGMRIPTP